MRDTAPTIDLLSGLVQYYFLEAHAGVVNWTAGDIATSAKLTSGAVTDLNVMTRRQRYVHRMQRIRQPTSCKCDETDIAVTLSFNGSATLTLQHDIVTLDHGDAAILAPAREPVVQLVPFTAGDSYLVLLRELGPR